MLPRSSAAAYILIFLKYFERILSSQTIIFFAEVGFVVAIAYRCETFGKDEYTSYGGSERRAVVGASVIDGGSSSAPGRRCTASSSSRRSACLGSDRFASSTAASSAAVPSARSAGSDCCELRSASTCGFGGCWDWVRSGRNCRTTSRKQCTVIVM